MAGAYGKCTGKGGLQNTSGHGLMRGSKKVCKNKFSPPPGDLIYSKDEYSIHEVDGEEHKVSVEVLFRSIRECTLKYV